MISFIRSNFTNAQIEVKTWLPCVLMVLVGNFAKEALDFLGLQRFMVLLHFAPSLVDRADTFVVDEGRLATNQRQNTFRAIFVLEDLLCQKQGEFDLLLVDFPRGVRLQFKEERDSLLEATPLVFRGEGHLGIAFQRHDELFFELALYVVHVLRRRVPDIREDIAELQPVARACPEHLSIQLVLGLEALPPPFLLLPVQDPSTLPYELEGHRDGDVPRLIEGADEIQALEGSTL